MIQLTSDNFIDEVVKSCAKTPGSTIEILPNWQLRLFPLESRETPEFYSPNPILVGNYGYVVFLTRIDEICNTKLADSYVQDRYWRQEIS